MRRWSLAVVAPLLWIACASNGERSDFAACAAGETRACTCDGGASGTQACSPAGELGACECTTPPLPSKGPAGPSVCGDGTCSADETCRACSQDCGVCPKCPLAPSCSDAVGVPSNPIFRGDLSDPKVAVDGGAPDAGAASASTCGEPELRMRIESITAHSGGGPIYCVVSATDGVTSEAAVTQKTKSLGDNETNYFDPSTAIYWGQGGLHKTSNNLTVTFNCFVVKDDKWAQVVKAMGDTATQLGGTPTPYGWAFGLGGIAANAAAAGIQAGAGDELRFNAQQVLDKSQLLDLTNGETWSFRRKGDCGLFCNWDWEIRVQSWGCADGRTPTK